MRDFDSLLNPKHDTQVLFDVRLIGFKINVEN